MAGDPAGAPLWSRRALLGLSRGAAPAAGLRPEVDPARCTVCGACAWACPLSVVEYTDDDELVALWLTGSRCDGCRACQRVCPHDALRVGPAAPGARPPEALRTRLAVAVRPACLGCGQPLAPTLQSGRIGGSLSASHPALAVAQGRLCADCLLSGVRVNRGP